MDNKKLTRTVNELKKCGELNEYNKAKLIQVYANVSYAMTQLNELKKRTGKLLTPMLKVGEVELFTDLDLKVLKVAGNVNTTFVITDIYKEAVASGKIDDFLASIKAQATVVENLPKNDDFRSIAYKHSSTKQTAAKLAVSPLTADEIAAS